MAALLALFAIELILKSKTGGHSHGGPTGQSVIQGGLAGQGAPPGTAAPPTYRPDTSMSDDSYIDEKSKYYARYVFTRQFYTGT